MHTIAQGAVQIGDYLVPTSTIFVMVVVAVFLWRVYDSNRTQK